MPNITATMSKTLMGPPTYAPPGGGASEDRARQGSSESRPSEARPAEPRPADRRSTAPRVASFGELLWDLYAAPSGAAPSGSAPSGSTSPTSAAPHSEGARHLGGAPANLAFHARAAGAQAILVSRIGDDDLGREARSLLEERGLDTSGLEVDPRFPTGSVVVRFDDGQPSYTILEDVAWDHIELPPNGIAALGALDAFCFGSLAARSSVSRASLERALDTLTPSTNGSSSPNESSSTNGSRPLLLLDVNLRPPFVDVDWLLDVVRRVDVVKCNEEELAWLTQAWARPVEEIVFEGRARWLAVTRGARGARLTVREASGALSQHDAPAVPSRGSDPVGAGDAFAAELIVGLCRGEAPDVVLERANRRAAWVAEQPGAMPVQ
ncbi:MAG TPA: PfkB family carbohydrate kinase, partial [Polyangiaceae bacterium]|nr:PfkB family carbohydrate kinase [Polyangiaceae bacterium]